MRTRNQLYDSNSRDFKSAAIKGIQTPQVQEWLGLSRAPPTEARRQLLERVIARGKEHPERQARVDALIRARNAPKSHGLLYYRLIAVVPSEARAISKEEQAALKLAEEERKRAEQERVVRKARLDDLAKLRTASNVRWFGSYYVMATRISRPMPFTLSQEVFTRIASYTQPTTLRDLTTLSRLTLNTLRPLLYGRIVVADSAQVLVNSLASNPELPPMVHSILFLPSALVIEGPIWERVLCQLTNLTQLGISDHMRLTQGRLHNMSFQLLSFVSFSDCPPVWADLLQQQRQLEILEIRGDLLGQTPLLPALQTACLNAAVAAEMLELNHLPDVEFLVQHPADPSISPQHLRRFSHALPGLERLRLRCTQLVCFLDNALPLLQELRSLVVDGDPSWTTNLLAKHFRSAASLLLPKQLPQMRKVRFVSAYRHPDVSKMSRQGAAEFNLTEQTADGGCAINGDLLTREPTDWAEWYSDPGLLKHMRPEHMFHAFKFSSRSQDAHPRRKACELCSSEPERMPLEPIMDWLMQRSAARHAELECLQRLEDLRLATPYERPGPETPLERDWCLSMQDLADFAEEVIAEREQAWQDTFQSIVDWHSENFRPPRIPQIGTQAYFDFVGERRERLALAQVHLYSPVRHRVHGAYRPLRAGANSLAERHNMARPQGFGQLQTGERKNVNPIATTEDSTAEYEAEYSPTWNLGTTLGPPLPVTTGKDGRGRVADALQVWKNPFRSAVYILKAHKLAGDVVAEGDVGNRFKGNGLGGGEGKLQRNILGEVVVLVNQLRHIIKLVAASAIA
ncbi:hypothetical protein C8J57DRAFT_1632449 [Mycena rebaudengoi]|nr:hypothetical protein C8J57DRAFT_1632449 [Mycena rebaudengoi]